VSIRPCSIHGQRVAGKLATFYNRWPNDDGEWERWKQRLCVQCATELLGHLKAGLSETSSDLIVCWVCGLDASADLRELYLTVYPPKSEPREYAITTCASCAPPLRSSLKEGAELLRNRPGFDAGVSGPSTEEWADF
jgi:hypothetical protein